MNNIRLTISARAALLAAGASFALPAVAQAPIGPPAATAVAEQPAEAAPAAPETVEDAYDDYSEDEIVVTAPRLAGQLDTDIKAEAELDEAAIASYGVSNVSELLDALAPQTRSGRGRGGGRPIILVNGRRIGGFGEVRNLPPEAIAKVEVFPEEVALQYGYSADERVVNMVLKPNFRQIAVEGEGGIPTQGGRFQSEIQPSFLAIGENGRLNVNAGWEHKSMLLESERDLDYDDPAQAAEAPARSLLGASDEYSIDATIQRSLNKTTDASINVRFDQTDTLSLLGPGVGGVGDPLERDGRSRNLTTTASVNGMLGDWRWSLSSNYADADQLTFTDRISGTRDRFESSQQTFGGNANLSGTVTDGWAGPIRLSMTGSYSGLRFDSRSDNANGITTTDLARDLPGVFGSLTVPLLDPEYEVGNIGRVSLTLSGQVQNPSDFEALKSWGANVNWGVTDNLSLIASFNQDEAAPGIQQLGAAPLVTPAVTYYDFATGQTVQITTTTGGNPFLLAEQRRDLKFGLNWSPPMLEGLNVSVNYNSNKSYDTANSFPLLTPEIEAAFPDRVTRDANGVLLALDQRPVNFDRVENSQIRWGLNFGKSFGQQEQRGRGAGGPGGARPEGAGTREGGGPGAGEGRRRGGGGPRMGGRGGRGGPGGMFGGPQGGRWQVSLYHTIKLTDKVLIRPGVPELDLLNGSATGSGGGSNRHLFELDGGLFNKGMGVRLSAKYDSGSTVTGGTAGDLKFGDLATFNLRFFVDLGQKPKLTEKLPFLKGSRLRLAVDNIFDAQRKITDANGRVPLNYQPGYIDALGRYIELEWRKTF
ncbi:ABC transporter ATP-binding protein [Sphingopyxis sp. H038]|uniref:TonB-dependent receptor plug domain-containing protein n=1 Tax=unclassified Sphingopyxis TaxID=2614943 RepID=UPI00072FF700|nr:MULTISPECIES: ABC transporter ATP-binding protein [unclassified Sphingopyxis]KTE01072.1 ABC transporter ATP-binding protein [Sphingopyxis sp. H012]KTE12419.1 ABC transporter ATP-binding protein [Sphingopyxis sp. H053]KTE14121.1 ABC transporter ATP-binding protein [Sphingopyxis sp. H093]KTE23668.1 ABC transporter ATP-binding protein [Sphingopyxis sp. H080]KTE32476.1 ABC transporter ATP-binding protein [Sphingopyxis sp. H038]